LYKIIKEKNTAAFIVPLEILLSCLSSPTTHIIEQFSAATVQRITAN